MSSIVCVAKFPSDHSVVRLAVDDDPTFPSPVLSDPVAVSGGIARLEVTGLSANTTYYAAVKIGSRIKRSTITTFKTLPTGVASFKCAFAGDASSNSNHRVFDAIRAKAPLFFIHLGDLHYASIATNDVDLFRDAWDGVFRQRRQARLYREVPTYYMWDDHDYGPNNSHAGSTPRPAALQAYRERVPHPPLVLNGATDPVYYSFDVGRVKFIVTDQRSMASNRTADDDVNKTVLGSAQKTWFKNILSDAANDGKFFIWVCNRCWGGVATTNADHWGGFTTERTELANHMLAECSGRIAVLSADMHSLAIDSGTNHEFANPGSMPVPTFQAAPLDRVGNETYGGATYNQGAGRYTTQGQFGVMEVTDAGGTTITIDWTGYNADGTQLVTYQFTPTIGSP